MTAGRDIAGNAARTLAAATRDISRNAACAPVATTRGISGDVARALGAAPCNIAAARALPRRVGLGAPAAPAHAFNGGHQHAPRPGIRWLDAWAGNPPTLRRAALVVALTMTLGVAAAQEQPSASARQPLATPAQANVSTTAPAQSPARPPAAQPRASAAPAAQPEPATAPAASSAAASATAPATPATPATTPAAAPAAVPAAPAPVVMPAAPAAGSLLQTTLALVFVLAVLAALAWFLKRYGPRAGGGSANLRVVGALSLGGRERIMVVEVGDQWIVVGASPGRVNALATLPRQPGVEPASVLAGHATPAAGFADWLKQTLDKRNAK